MDVIFPFFLSSADVGLKQKNAGEEISKLGIPCHLNRDTKCCFK